MFFAKNTWQVFEAFVNFIALNEFEEPICVHFSRDKSKIRSHELEGQRILFCELRNSVEEQCKDRVHFVSVLPCNCAQTFVLRLYKVEGLREKSFVPCVF